MNTTSIQRLWFVPCHLQKHFNLKCGSLLFLTSARIARGFLSAVINCRPSFWRRPQANTKKIFWPTDSLAVAVHIRGHVDDRGEGNHDGPQADLPVTRPPVSGDRRRRPSHPGAQSCAASRGADCCLNSVPGWRVAELARRKTNLTFSCVARLVMPGGPLTACPNRSPAGHRRPFGRTPGKPRFKIR
jgi:hypothetical protein